MKESGCGWYCQECGHAYKSFKAANAAAFNEKGCPKCGSSDVDCAPPKSEAPKAEVA